MAGRCLSSEELHALFNNVLLLMTLAGLVAWLLGDWMFRCPHCAHCRKEKT